MVALLKNFPLHLRVLSKTSVDEQKSLEELDITRNSVPRRLGERDVSNFVSHPRGNRARWWGEDRRVSEGGGGLVKYPPDGEGNLGGKTVQTALYNLQSFI